jgi:hypothetical protein
MEPKLKVNAPNVVAEVIDGEAVIMDLTSGHYFSTQHVGCVIWRGIELGASRSAIARSLASAYDVDPDAASAAVESFVGDLLQHNLVVETSGSSSGAEEQASWLSDARQPYSPPVLNTYTDMEELLLLDPIHDVDQAGWPMPKVPDAPAS